MNKDNKNYISKEFFKGILYTFSAFFLWGILPSYWKLLTDHATSFEILLHRIIWLFIFFIILNLISKRKEVFILLKNKKTRFLLILSSLMIGLNWFFYIYAINTNRIVESSLGYYINPLISILFGLVFLKERLNKLQWIAVFLALIGVLILTIKYGKVTLVINGNFL